MALGFAARGWDLAIHYRNSASAAEELVRELQSQGANAVALSGDLRDASVVRHLVPRATDELGPLTALINNASVFRPTADPNLPGPAGDMIREDLEVHVEAPLILSQSFAQQVPESATGTIVNLLDWRAMRPDPQYLTYSIAKAGLRAVTENLAIALAPRVTVNAVAPGAILPPNTEPGASPAAPDPETLERVPAQRWGDMADIVQACLFLALEAPYVTGCVLPVDGGRHLT